MIRVHIPALLQDLTGQAALVEVELADGQALSVRQLLDRLNARYPGFADRLIYRDDLIPGVAVFVDGQQGYLKLREKVSASSEVHFLPPIVGG